MRHTRLLPIALAGFALACSGGEAPAPEEYADAVTADPDHYSVEFENDAVRLVRVSYGAGEESVMHTHPDNCAIFFGDQTVTFELPDGEVLEPTTFELGQLQCGDAAAHRPTNVGDEPVRAILIELKEGAMAGDATSEYPLADEADPDHYTVEWENDAIRLLRITYGPGETSTMHHHPANCAIFLGAQEITFEMPDGEIEEPPVTEVGQLTCVDAHDHLPTNVSEEPLELVLLEFKGRAAVE